MAEQASGGGEYADPLVLEHMMGFTGYKFVSTEEGELELDMW